jgi:hypothetical protein
MQAANLPRATVLLLFPEGFDHTVKLKEPTNGALRVTVQTLRALDEYLAHFTMVIDGKCPCCQSSFQTEAGIEWTLTHGEAQCTVCHYPYRVYHRDIGEIERIVLSLPYHPDQLERKRKRHE